MNRLIILSDLWGGEKPNWLLPYQKVLSQYFEIHYYDCRQLADIDHRIETQTDIHQAFLNGGIDNAIQNLIEKEKKAIVVLAFSMGGVIAWKAISAGLKAKLFFAVSSTRLRYETQKLKTNVKLYYGTNDEYAPTEKHLNEIGAGYTFFKNEGHDLYKQNNIARFIASELINHFQSKN